jgi:acyl-CoA synthetase (AMP-forming)/AMP-acid ligase II
MRPIPDPVPRDTPGALTIGFAPPERYNAASILFDNLARGNAGRIAVTGSAGTRTYGELCGEAGQIGHALLAFGCQPAERVICLLDDTPDYPAVVFGAMRAGLVPVLLNTLSPPDLIQFYALDSGARVAFVQGELFAKIGAEAFAAAGISLAILCGATDASQQGALATIWRSGCTPPAQRASRRASCICITTCSTRPRATVGMS